MQVMKSCRGAAAPAGVKHKKQAGPALLLSTAESNLCPVTSLTVRAVIDAAGLALLAAAR